VAGQNISCGVLAKTLVTVGCRRSGGNVLGSGTDDGADAKTNRAQPSRWRVAAMHSALEHNSQSRPTAVRQLTGSGDRPTAVPYVGYEHRTMRSENIQYLIMS
jgi:hypothetical protein